MKKACPLEEQLQRWLDGADKSPQANVISEHVNTCGRCQSRLEELTNPVWIKSSILPGGAGDWLIERLAQMAPGDSGSSWVGDPFSGTGDPQAPLGRLQEYRILKRVAEGAQGILYLAFDEKLKRQVAIKVLRQNLLSTGNSRFEREARLAASLNDERIVRIYQIGHEPGVAPFIVMEYVEGSSLKQILDSQIPKFFDSVRWVREAAIGLSAAHEAGLIHRDIKPSNLMVDAKTGLVRLTDFGLAMEQADEQRITQDGVLTGTPAYMSPEQLLRPETVDQRTDVYSLGVVLYELLTGEVPFRGTVRMTLLQLAHDAPRAPRQLNDQIPRDLETIALKAMARERSARFGTAKEFADELGRWQEGEPILSRPAGLIERLWRWCRRRPGIASVSAISLGLLLTLIMVMFVSNSRLKESASIQKQHADSATRQRDAALATLSQLVYELQTQFEQDETDLDDLQRNALQIAIDGLNRLRNLTDGEKLPSRLTAEAFRRMGDILLRKNQIDEARNCLIRAETGFRQLELQPTERLEALRGLVETYWSRHDLEVDAGVENSTLKWLQLATEVARKLFDSVPSNENRLVLSEALFHESQAEYDEADWGQSLKSLEPNLVEIQNLAEPKNIVADESQLKQDLTTFWLKAAALQAQYQLSLGDDVKANATLSDALSQLNEHRTGKDLLDSVSSQELVLQFQLYNLLLKKGKDEQSQARLQQMERQLEQLANLVADGSVAFEDGLIFLQDLTDHFDEEDDPDGLSYFLKRELKFIDWHLSRVPGDEFALLERAWCRSRIAETLEDQDISATKVRQAYQSAIEEYRDLSSRGSFEEQHWYYFCMTLLSAAEYEQSIEGNQLESLVDEAKKLRSKLGAGGSAFLPADYLDEIDERIRELEKELEETVFRATYFDSREKLCTSFPFTTSAKRTDDSRIR